MAQKAFGSLCSTTGTVTSHESTGSGRRNFLLACFALLVGFLAISSRGVGDAEKPALQTVRLAIDYSDGVQKRFTIPLKRGMTVLDAMNEAQASSHGITFHYDRKDGPETFLLTQIDDLKNEGSGPGKKNWLYWVNGKEAAKGFAEYKLKASDTVVWRFSGSHMTKK